MKNIGQGDAAWSTKNKVLGWELNKKEHHLRLTPNHELKVRAALEAIPTEAHQVSLRKRCHPLGLLWSITPAIYGAHGLLMRLQHALWQARDRRFQMSPAVQDELSA